MKTKNTTRFSLFTLILSAMLLSACSAAPAVAGDNSNVNGSPSTPIIVDTGNSSNSNDVNSNDANSNDVNSNEANSNDNMGSDGNSNDSGIEIVGVVEAITEDTITINGVTYLLPAGFAEFKDLVSVGDQVKVHVIFNADGTFTILQAEISTGDDNGNDANSNDANSNDDNGNDTNSNDDNGNDSNSNDDSGGNDNGSGGGGNDNGGGGGSDDGGGGNDNGSNDNG